MSSGLGIAFGTQNHFSWKKHLVGLLCPKGRTHHLPLNLIEWFSSQRRRAPAFPALLPLSRSAPAPPLVSSVNLESCGMVTVTCCCQPLRQGRW